MDGVVLLGYDEVAQDAAVPPRGADGGYPGMPLDRRHARCGVSLAVGPEVDPPRAARCAGHPSVPDPHSCVITGRD